MRSLVAVALVLPLLAGCSNPAHGPRIEAFTATYAIATGLQVEASFGDPIDFLAADGSTQQGYLLHVQYSAPGTRLGYDETMYDADLQPVRAMRCQGAWVGGTCTEQVYAWAVDGETTLVTKYDTLPFDMGHHEGFVLNLPSEHGDHRAANATFDDKLAPTSFAWEGVATRTDYVARGPLAPLASQPLVRLDAGPVLGPGLPGGDRPLAGVPFSLDDAIAFVQTEEPQAAAILASGGCVQRFQVHSYEPLEMDDQVQTQDHVEATFVLSVTNRTHRSAFTLEYGRAAPLGEQRFLRSSFAIERSNRIDCAARGPVAALTDLAQRLDKGFPDHGFAEFAWMPPDEAGTTLRLVLGTNRAPQTWFDPEWLSMAGESGFLVTWQQPSRPVDP